MADPADLNNVVLLANFDGTDGDTSYTPEIGGAFTFNGNAELDSSVTQFSNTTLYVDGSGDTATWGTAADIQFLHDRTADYTIEVFARRPTLAVDGYILTTRGTNCGVILYINTAGAIQYTAYRHTGTLMSATSADGVISAATMHYIKVTFDDAAAELKVRVDGTEVATDTTISTPQATVNSNYALTLGSSAHSTFRECEVNYGPIRITEGEALDDSDVPTGVFPDTVINSARISLPGPLSAPTARAVNDFSSLITDSRSFYVMEISGDPVLRIPVSSWQATVQSDRSSYLQAVIPAADDYASEISARLGVSDFSVSRLTYINGVEHKSELARAALETTAYAKGANKSTVTLSGYDVASESGSGGATVTLSGLRTITTSSTGTTRVRCDIDWFLRPGDTAVADGSSFTVKYINYYVPSTGDIYMDVGDRQ